MGYTNLIIDGNHMAHRARHTFNLSWRGKDVSTLYGVLRMLTLLLSKYKPNSMLVAWDGGVPNYRRKYYPNYKMNRNHDKDETYDSFVEQLRELSAILPKCGVVQVRREGIEGDDLCYAASRMLEGNNLIVSGDDDLLQAVNDRTHVLQPGKMEIIVTLDNFADVTGIEHHELSVPCYAVAKTLAGDSSDNITGIVGVGMKTAVSLVNTCGIWYHPGAVDDIKYVEIYGYNESKWAHKLDTYIGTGLYEHVYKVVDLSIDRTGARHTVLNAAWQSVNIQSINAWFTRWGFASLVTMGAAAEFNRLAASTLDCSDLLIPMVWDYERWPQ
jgi:5'-3' exonuclease